MRIIVLLAALLAATPAVAQQRIDRPGPVPHAQARAIFPEQVGAFRRANVVSYRPDGSDISASYNLARDGGRVLITVYIYPAPRIVAGPGGGDTAAVARASRCLAEFEGTNQAVARAHGGAQPLESGPAEAPAGVGAGLAHRSVFRLRANFDNRMQDIRSEAWLYCYVGGDWLVKYRASSSEGMDATADIEAFIAQGPWPGRAPAAEPRTVAP